MKITPLDIQQQVFKENLFKGYDKKEVDEFLNLVSTELEKITVENFKLNEELKQKKSLLLAMSNKEKILKDTMITTQRITEDIKQNAKKEAEIIISQSQIQAERIIRTAQDRLTDIMDDINELKRQRVMFEASLRSIIDKHKKLIEITSEEETGEIPLEDKLSIFPSMKSP